ncbi:PPA1309 family protein [Actinokineospora sp.]|uniref:PPA1309 family protein n=1 Tax=Actinokineospora sp. TaxID=1872133 RepID=UPI004037748A
MCAVSEPSPHDLPSLAREVEEFVSSGGWDQPPQLFALVSTEHLLREQPDLAGQVDPGAALTPVAQESLPDEDLGAALAGIMWPPAVSGCALAQEIVMLPPDAEADLPEPDTDTDAIRTLAASHPKAREARLVAAALRDGTVACVLRLRSADGEIDEVVEHPELAPNLTAALLDTLS